MSTMARRRLAGEAGFTLIEVLLATLLMTVILAALATVTAQWLPNWNKGMARVQRAERLAMGLDRIVADLSVAEMIAVNSDARKPLFEGSELAVTFLRTAVGPNTRPGLEIIRFIEKADSQGLAMVRERATVRADADGCADPFRRSGRADPFAVSRDVFLCRIRSGLAARSGAARRSFRTWSVSRCATAPPAQVLAVSRRRHGPRQCAGGMRAGQESGGLTLGATPDADKAKPDADKKEEQL